MKTVCKRAASAGACLLLASAAMVGLTHCESDDTPRTAPPPSDAAEEGKVEGGASDGPSEATSLGDSSSDSGRPDTATTETGTPEAGPLDTGAPDGADGAQLEAATDGNIDSSPSPGDAADGG